jgi:hypothetical protein
VSIRIPLILITSVVLFAAVGPLLPGGFLSFVGLEASIFWTIGGPPAAIAGLVFGILITIAQPYFGQRPQLGRTLYFVAAAFLGAVAGAIGIAIWTMLKGVDTDPQAFQFYRALFLVSSIAGAICGVVVSVVVVKAIRWRTNNEP